MAKRIIRYLLEGNGTIPVFVFNGGYFQKNNEVVGVSVDEDVRHVPSSVIRMNRVELLERISLTCKDADGNFLPRPGMSDTGPYTEEDMEELLEEFLDQVGPVDCD